MKPRKTGCAKPKKHANAKMRRQSKRQKMKSAAPKTIAKPRRSPKQIADVQQDEVEAASEEPAPAAEVAEEAPADDAAPDETAPPAAKSTAPAARKFTPVARPEVKRPEKKRDDKPKRVEERPDKRRSGKLTVSRALNEDEGPPRA